METNIRQYTCRDCIWSDQCEDNQICSFYDDENLSMELTEVEIELRIERERALYKKEFLKYVKEYGYELF